MPPDTAATTLAILAGGAGSRMGKPKSLLTLNQQPVLEYLLTRMSWPGPTLLVTTPGREHPPGHHRFTREVADPTPDLGPLRGLLTALEACTTPLLLVTTVDMPRVAGTHLDFLLRSINDRPDALGLMLQRQTGDGMQIEPFPAVYRTIAREHVAAHLAAERRSVHSLSRRNGFVTVPAPPDWPATMWTNLNHPADLDRFLHDAD